MFNRKDFSEKYYKNWKPKHDVFKLNRDEITDEFLVEFYKEYRLKLIDFVNELDLYIPNITKVDFNQNYRQSGSYRRCVLEFPDNGWTEKYFQFEQAYKELMIDFLYYSDELEYEDISLNEIQIMKKMAYFLICQAEINIYKLTCKEK